MTAVGPCPAAWFLLFSGGLRFCLFFLSYVLNQAFCRNLSQLPVVQLIFLEVIFRHGEHGGNRVNLRAVPGIKGVPYILDTLGKAVIGNKNGLGRSAAEHLHDILQLAVRVCLNVVYPAAG